MSSSAEDLVDLRVRQSERPETARRLLAAAEQAGLHPHVVRSTGDGYIVPARVAELAFGDPTEEPPSQEPDLAADGEDQEDTAADAQAESKPSAKGRRPRGKEA